MAFVENKVAFMVDFAEDATLNGVAVRGIPSGETIDPLTGLLMNQAPSFTGDVDVIGSALPGDALVISAGRFAGTYRVAEPPMLDTSREFAVLKLERIA